VVTPVQIEIDVEGVVLRAVLADSAAARALAKALPFDARYETWGEEHYFPVPVDLPEDETATTKVKAGDLGYWPPGKALAVFWGRTPMSTGKDPVPYSAVLPMGRVVGDASVLRDTPDSGRVHVRRASSKPAQDRP
jgi:hypothetical protein